MRHSQPSNIKLKVWKLDLELSAYHICPESKGKKVHKLEESSTMIVKVCFYICIFSLFAAYHMCCINPQVL